MASLQDVLMLWSIPGVSTVTDWLADKLWEIASKALSVLLYFLSMILTFILGGFAFIALLTLSAIMWLFLTFFTYLIRILLFMPFINAGLFPDDIALIAQNLGVDKYLVIQAGDLYGIVWSIGFILAIFVMFVRLVTASMKGSISVKGVVVAVAIMVLVPDMYNLLAVSMVYFADKAITLFANSSDALNAATSFAELAGRLTLGGITSLFSWEAFENAWEADLGAVASMAGYRAGGSIGMLMGSFMAVAAVTGVIGFMFTEALIAVVTRFVAIALAAFGAPIEVATSEGYVTMRSEGKGFEAFGVFGKFVEKVEGFFKPGTSGGGAMDVLAEEPFRLFVLGIILLFVIPIGLLIVNLSFTMFSDALQASLYDVAYQGNAVLNVQTNGWFFDENIEWTVTYTVPVCVSSSTTTITEVVDGQTFTRVETVCDPSAIVTLSGVYTLRPREGDENFTEVVAQFNTVSIEKGGILWFRAALALSFAILLYALGIGALLHVVIETTKSNISSIGDMIAQMRQGATQAAFAAVSGATAALGMVAGMAAAGVGVALGGAVGALGRLGAVGGRVVPAPVRRAFAGLGARVPAVARLGEGTRRLLSKGRAAALAQSKRLRVFGREYFAESAALAGPAGLVGLGAAYLASRGKSATARKYLNQYKERAKTLVSRKEIRERIDKFKTEFKEGTKRSLMARMEKMGVSREALEKAIERHRAPSLKAALEEAKRVEVEERLKKNIERVGQIEFDEGAELIDKISSGKVKTISREELERLERLAKIDPSIAALVGDLKARAALAEKGVPVTSDEVELARRMLAKKHVKLLRDVASGEVRRLSRRDVRRLEELAKRFPELREVVEDLKKRAPRVGRVELTDEQVRKIREVASKMHIDLVEKLGTGKIDALTREHLAALEEAAKYDPGARALLEAVREKEKGVPLSRRDVEAARRVAERIGVERYMKATRREMPGEYERLITFLARHSPGFAEHLARGIASGNEDEVVGAVGDVATLKARLEALARSHPDKEVRAEAKRWMEKLAEWEKISPVKEAAARTVARRLARDEEAMKRVVEEADLKKVLSDVVDRIDSQRRTELEREILTPDLAGALTRAADVGGTRVMVEKMTPQVNSILESLMIRRIQSVQAPETKRMYEQQYSALMRRLNNVAKGREAVSDDLIESLWRATSGVSAEEAKTIKEYINYLERMRGGVPAVEVESTTLRRLLRAPAMRRAMRRWPEELRRKMEEAASKPGKVALDSEMLYAIAKAMPEDSLRELLAGARDEREVRKVLRRALGLDKPLDNITRVRMKFGLAEEK